MKRLNINCKVQHVKEMAKIYFRVKRRNDGFKTHHVARSPPRQSSETPPAAPSPQGQSQRSAAPPPRRAWGLPPNRPRRRCRCSGPPSRWRPVRKRVSGLSFFPYCMFVPSLSWQSDATFSTKWYRKKTSVFTPRQCPVRYCV